MSGILELKDGLDKIKLQKTAWIRMWPQMDQQGLYVFWTAGVTTVFMLIGHKWLANEVRRSIKEYQ